MVSTLTYQAGIYFATGRTPQRMGNRHPSIVPYETFEAADGYLNLGVANDTQWRALCCAINIPELSEEPRFATVALRVKNYADLRPRLDALLRRNTVAHWLGLFRGAGLPCGEVRTVQEALEDPQLRARNMILELDHPRAGKIRVTGMPIKLSAMESLQASAPPLHGQHNREVYCGLLGLSDQQLEELKRDHVI